MVPVERLSHIFRHPIVVSLREEPFHAGTLLGLKKINKVRALFYYTFLGKELKIKKFETCTSSALVFMIHLDY